MANGPEPAADDRERRVRRALAFAAVLTVHLLLVLALLFLVKPNLKRFGQPGAMVVTLLPEDAPPAPKATAKRVFRTAATVKAKAPTPVKPPTAKQPLPIIVISKADMAAGDISKIPSVAPAATAGAGQPGDSELADGGGGPHGEPLYRAEWYREPTHAELVTYVPHNVGEGSWAIIACKTIEHFHVEDCEELGESPPGSGLARGLRQAAWQFLIRPPRVGGKAQIGAWVSIRYSIIGAKSEG